MKVNKVVYKIILKFKTWTCRRDVPWHLNSYHSWPSERSRMIPALKQ